jgi:alcohol dehydrogenase
MTGTGVLRLPSDVRFGYGSRVALPSLAARFGNRVAFVADPFLARTPEFAEALRAVRAAGLETLVLSDVPAELPVQAVVDAAETVRRFAPDVIVGYGGGSALDAAKVVSLLVSYGGSPGDYYGENAVPGPVVPLIAVPTTAGTGSEVTPVAVVSDPAREVKVGISSPWLVPAIALVDPELTVGAPPSVTAHAGIDAFVHAVESYTAASIPLDHSSVLPVFVGRNVLTDPLSLEAAALIHEALPVVLARPTDRDARERMARASLFAGAAFGSAGTHLSHALQYPIGALTHTPHGLGTGLLLPYVLQASLSAVPDRLARLGEALGVAADGDEVSRAQATVDAIAVLCERIGLPCSLAEIGITAADRERVIALTLQARRLVGIAPITADEITVGAIFDAALAGERTLLTTLTEPTREERS